MKRVLMSVGDATARERYRPMHGLERARSRMATPAVLAACIAIYLFPLALLAVIFLYMRGFAHASWRIGARSFRHA
jgi:hypothetical protein